MVQNNLGLEWHYMFLTNNQNTAILKVPYESEIWQFGLKSKFLINQIGSIERGFLWTNNKLQE